MTLFDWIAATLSYRDSYKLEAYSVACIQSRSGGLSNVFVNKKKKRERQYLIIIIIIMISNTSNKLICALHKDAKMIGERMRHLLKLS